LEKRIIIISEYNHLVQKGGIEYYVSMLATGILKYGYKVLMISKGLHLDGVTENIISSNGLSYKLYLLPNKVYTKQEITQSVVSNSWNYIAKIIRDFNPHLLHVHTFTTFFNIRHIELCKEFVKNIIFTTHLPGNFCAKGDMVYLSKKQCKGIIGFQCNICLFSKSFNLGLSSLLNNHDILKKNVLAKMNNLNIKIITTSNWQIHQILCNGYKRRLISTIRQSLFFELLPKSNKTFIEKQYFNVGYLGRLSHEKGSDLLFKLFDMFKYDNNIKFTLGVSSNLSTFEKKRLEFYKQSKPEKFEIFYNLNEEDKSLFFSSIDLLIIPSFCLETGPIVLLESVYYRTKVLVPDVGGPYEYSFMFPDAIELYKWDSLNDLYLKVNMLRKSSNLITKSNESQLRIGEKEFFEKHLLIYNEAIEGI
jgi:glycosyltransferase involved in cell wall biosynthesis